MITKNTCDQNNSSLLTFSGGTAARNIPRVAKRRLRSLASAAKRSRSTGKTSWQSSTYEITGLTRSAIGAGIIESTVKLTIQ